MKLQLIVISPPGNYRNECELVCQMFAIGLKKYHLRKPKWKSKELENFILQFPPQWRKRLVIHSHFSLRNKWKLGGIHLTEKARTKKNIALHRQKGHLLSSSFHDLNDIRQLAYPFTYVFLSPVFNSISKKGYKAAFSKDELKKVLTKNRKIIALGGITPRSLSKTHTLGFGGAATLGYIWKSKDPVKAFMRMYSKIK